MKYSVLFIIALNLPSCTLKEDKVSTEMDTKVLIDSFSGHMIADTIVYDVIIKNQNPDDIWAKEFLKYVKIDTLVNMIFSLAYSEKVEVYDHFTGEKLTKRDIKKIENQKDFKRELIGKIQFTEKWYFDVKNNKMNKEILTITPGYEIYYSDTTFGGYKPVFKIVLK